MTTTFDHMTSRPSPTPAVFALHVPESASEDFRFHARFSLTTSQSSKRGAGDCCGKGVSQFLWTRRGTGRGHSPSGHNSSLSFADGVWNPYEKLHSGLSSPCIRMICRTYSSALSAVKVCCPLSANRARSVCWELREIIQIKGSLIQPWSWEHLTQRNALRQCKERLGKVLLGYVGESLYIVLSEPNDECKLLSRMMSIRKRGCPRNRHPRTGPCL